MKDYAVYEQTTGRIIRTGVTTNVEAQAISAGEVAVAAKALPSTHYFNGSNIVLRPENPVSRNKTVIESDGSDEVAISGVPAGSRVTVNGPVRGGAEVNDGEFIFTTEVPGEYEITVFSFPARNATFKVVAV